MPVHELEDDDGPLDANGRLRDGKVLRVRMSARDSNTVRGQIAADRARVVDGAGDAGVALHRPGPRMLADRSAYDAAEQARQQMIADQSAAWKTGPGNQQDADPPPNAVGPYEEHLVGTVCTLNGQDGRLEASDDGQWLICRPVEQRNDSVPAWHPGLSLADGERIKEEAYLARIRIAERAWKILGRS